jgi:type IV secretory pathway VirB2 component (pilin)
VVKRITTDDYIVIITLFLSLGNSVFLTISASWGLGQHIELLLSSPDRISQTVKYVYLCEIFSIMCPCFGRIAFALMLLSLVPPDKVRRRILYAIIMIAFVVDVATVSISFAQCKPIEAFWDLRPEPNCWPKSVQQLVGFVQGSIGSAVDLTLAVFPASLFWNLKMSWKQKGALSCIMGLGVFAMVASIIKTVNLRALTATSDLTYEMARLAIWWTLEANFVLIAITIPTLRPIIKTRKASSRQQHGDSDGAYTNRNGPRSPRSKFDNCSFVPLQESPSDNNIETDHVSHSGLQEYELSDSLCTDDRNNNTNLGRNIRRDILVSVTYDYPSS